MGPCFLYICDEIISYARLAALLFVISGSTDFDHGAGGLSCVLRSGRGSKM